MVRGRRLSAVAPHVFQCASTVSRLSSICVSSEFQRRGYMYGRAPPKRGWSRRGTCPPRVQSRDPKSVRYGRFPSVPWASSLESLMEAKLFSLLLLEYYYYSSIIIVHLFIIYYYHHHQYFYYDLSRALHFVLEWCSGRVSTQLD